VLVPAGTPHAIGAGVLLVELQEPTDLSVLLEWAGFAAGPGEVRGRLEAVRALLPEPGGRPACIPGRSGYVDRVRRPSRTSG
jgi:hypothetical protein